MSSPTLAHLYTSVGDIYRPNQTIIDGVLTASWGLVYSEISSRLDIGFLRPGRDALPPQQAGRAQDRVGLMFLDTDTDIRPGDRYVTTSGPTKGTWGVNSRADGAIGYSQVHHVECQVVEVAPSIAQGQAYTGSADPEQGPVSGDA